MSKQNKKINNTKETDKPLKLSGSLNDLLKIALTPSKQTNKSNKNSKQLVQKIRKGKH